MLERPDRAEELLHLTAGQDVGQGLGSLRPGNLCDHLGSPQRRRVEELDRGDVHVHGRRPCLLLVHQVEQELADLRLAQHVRRPAVERDEGARSAQVLLPRGRARIRAARGPPASSLGSLPCCPSSSWMKRGTVEHADARLIADDVGRTTPAEQLSSETEGGAAARAAGSPRAVARPGLPQIRTCAIRASGSSGQGFAARRYMEWMARAGGSGYRASNAWKRSHVSRDFHDRRRSHLHQVSTTYEAEARDRRRVPGDPVVGEVPLELPRQHLLLMAQRRVPIEPTPRGDGLDGPGEAVARRLPLDHPVPRRDRAQWWVKPRKSKVPGWSGLRPGRRNGTRRVFSGCSVSP